MLSKFKLIWHANFRSLIVRLLSISLPKRENRLNKGNQNGQQFAIDTSCHNDNYIANKGDPRSPILSHFFSYDSSLA